MDEIDLQIAKKLLKNCRITYREIAEFLNLSVNAIYSRIQNMIDKGVIREFTAKPSLHALRAVQVLIFGESLGKNITEISQLLGKNECVYFVGNAGGNYLYIDGYLRKFNDLDDYISFINANGNLRDSQVAIRKLPYRITSEELNKLDYKILKVLNHNARMPVSQLAKEIKISAKTARKHIKKMHDYKLVEFSINFAPQTEGVITSQFHLHLSEGSDFQKYFQLIINNYSKNILYLQRFNNIPNLLMLTSLTKSNLETSKLHNKLLNEDFKKIEHRILFNGHFFETWRDKLYKQKLSEVV
jgi:DNA-binding Lrp family transcriptional regulator